MSAEIFGFYKPEMRSSSVIDQFKKPIDIIEGVFALDLNVATNKTGEAFLKIDFI